VLQELSPQESLLAGFQEQTYISRSCKATANLGKKIAVRGKDPPSYMASESRLKALGISIIPASAPDFFTEDTPTAALVRQVLGAIAQFEKASAVAKLAAARKRKRERDGRCEGRKPLSVTCES